MTLFALTLGLSAAACGGSDTPPAKDPSTDTPATMPSAPEQTPDPPPAASAAPAAPAAP